MTKFEKYIVPAIFCAIVAASVTMSQNTPPAQPAQQPAPQAERGERGRGDWDPAQMRQRVMDRLKEQMKTSDEEWTVLQPKLERVMTLQRQTRGGMGPGMGGWRGRDRAPEAGNDAAAPAATPLETSSRDLRATLENQDATPAEVAAKLGAYREARAKAQAELQTAREDLKQLLTARQEAVLVMAGMLE